MKRINSCFTIGTIGIILTSILQIVTTVFTSAMKFQMVFYILYFVFIIMLMIGYRKIVREKNHG